MSNLVTYSSGDEEDQQETKVATKVFPDVNYDDVQMEMSEDENDGDDDSEEDEGGDAKSSSSEESEKTVAEKNLFASEEDYLAYKKQFSKPNGSSNGNKASEATSSTEYGTEKPLQQVKDTAKEVAKGSQDSKVSKQQSFDKADQSSNSKGERQDRSRSRSPVRSGKKHDERKRGSHHSHHHRHQRSHSRSRSKDHERSSRREHRPRSRSSSRERRRRDSRDNDNGRDRQELRNRKLFSMGLTESDRPKVPQTLNLTGTNQERAIKAQLDHVKAVTGVDLPKYYNPTAINPLKYAEQIKKRQLLWGSKKTDDGHATIEPVQEAQKPAIVEQKPSSLSQSQGGSSYNKWETTNFGNSQANEKFRRLMGIKGTSDIEKVAEAPKVDSRQIFGQLEQEYERARAITHTQRGLGLGFSSIGGSAPQAPQPASSSAGLNFVKK